MTTQPMPAKEHFVKTGVCSHDLFNLIRINPREYTPRSAANYMATLKYKKSSVQALITQMKRNKMFQEDEYGKLFTTLAAYVPFENPYKKNPVSKPNSNIGKTRRAVTVKAGLAALPTKTAATTSATTSTINNTQSNPARLVRLQSAEEVLANLSVSEAYRLYSKLSTMFGNKQ